MNNTCDEIVYSRQENLNANTGLNNLSPTWQDTVCTEVDKKVQELTLNNLSPTCHGAGCQEMVNESGQEINSDNLSPSCQDTGDSELLKKVQELTLDELKKLEPLLETLEDIPAVFHQTPLKCLTPATLDSLCLYLDTLHDILTDHGHCKDFRGLVQLLRFENANAYINYLAKSVSIKKTEDVINKWIAVKKDPAPVLGNLVKFIADADKGIDRPDVITDLAKRICKDAYEWEKARFEAHSQAPDPVDLSWQLTIHDVISGKKSYYTCCLVYADEDEGMAQLITNFFQKVYAPIKFFLPQFHLLQGRYEPKATADVIADRCAGKVIFIISKYFEKSDICGFALNFSKSFDVDAKKGNLIPFFLSESFEHVPRVLTGISGVKWYIKTRRKPSLINLAQTMLLQHSGNEQNLEELERLQQSLRDILESEPQKYLIDPPYFDDDDTSKDASSIKDSSPPGSIEPVKETLNASPKQTNVSEEDKQKYKKKSLFHRLFSNKK